MPARVAMSLATRYSGELTIAGVTRLQREDIGRQEAHAAEALGRLDRPVVEQLERMNQARAIVGPRNQKIEHDQRVGRGDAGQLGITKPRRGPAARALDDGDDARRSGRALYVRASPFAVGTSRAFLNGGQIPCPESPSARAS